jgi:hypothetical protein
MLWKHPCDPSEFRNEQHQLEGNFPKNKQHQDMTAKAKRPSQELTCCVRALPCHRGTEAGRKEDEIDFRFAVGRRRLAGEPPHPRSVPATIALRHSTWLGLRGRPCPCRGRGCDCHHRPESQSCTPAAYPSPQPSPLWRTFFSRAIMVCPYSVGFSITIYYYNFLFFRD